MIERLHPKFSILTVYLTMLTACTGYSNSVTIPAEACCDKQAFPGMCWSFIARSPEVVSVQRLNRGIDDRGNLVYATSLIDGSCIAMLGQDDSFGVAYFFKHRLKDGVVHTGTFTVPDGNEPLGLLYVHVGEMKYLAVCHRSRQLGLNEAGSYRVMPQEGKNHIDYEILRYQNQEIPQQSEVDSFSIAEKGFCVDSKGILLWPGNLEQGDVYDIELWHQNNEEASNGL